MKTTGLTLGKFAPLHKGHHLLIETGLREMDELIVVIYDWPQSTDIPLPIRAGWIRRLYPSAEVIEAWDGPAETGYTPEAMRAQENYLLKLLQGREITHFYSSEPYGEHMSKALGAVNRKVDIDRRELPVSATMIRQDPYGCRDFVSPEVYRDLVTNVVFLGAPSTGKTTIAQAAAAHFQTVWMPEYGREYWEKHQVNRRLTPDQLTEIALGHLEREDQLLLEANQYLFTDTDPITTYVYARYYHGYATPLLSNLASQAEKRYDLFFLCDTDIPYEDTWDRSGLVYRATFQKRIIAELHARKIPYFVLRGAVQQRLDQLTNILGRFRKYGNVLAL